MSDSTRTTSAWHAWLAAAAGGLTSLTACMPSPCPIGFALDPDQPGMCVDNTTPEEPVSYVAPGGSDPRREVVEELSRRCARNDAESCTQLGGIFVRGAIVNRDARRGERYLLRGCQHHDAEACDELATLYTEDADLADPVKAAAMQLQACKVRGQTCSPAAPPESGADTRPATAPADGAAPEVHDGDVMIGSGTAFAISDDGLFATAAHVVDGADEIAVKCGDEELRAAKTVARASAVDVAVIHVDRKTRDYVPVVTDPDIALGDQVFTVGFPRPDALGLEPKFTDGTVSAVSVGGERNLMQLSVPVYPGNSGGALLTEEGVLYGVVVAKRISVGDETTDSISYAVKATFLAAILDAPYVHHRDHALTRKEAIRLTTAATCLVLTRSTAHR
ncbi:MAG TPA: trypsin-like peptidase domain-containing protein [Kofleriaceae bacterium]|nr:trypsin-like peptidase domain-containing protein [Kofleriaceae bacterium]